MFEGVKVKSNVYIIGICYDFYLLVVLKVDFSCFKDDIIDIEIDVVVVVVDLVF